MRFWPPLGIMFRAEGLALGVVLYCHLLKEKHFTSMVAGPAKLSLWNLICLPYSEWCLHEILA